MKFGRASGWLIAAGCLVAIAREPAVGKEIKTVVLGKRAARGVPAPAMPGKNVPAIKVNTVGYAVGWPKVAIFNVDPTGAVLKAADGSVALQISAARIEARGLDVASQDPVWQVDFSAFDTPGTYTLQVGDTVSDPFVVGDGIYAEAVRAGLKSFYYQRTRTALVAPYATWDGDTFGRAGVSQLLPPV